MDKPPRYWTDRLPFRWSSVWCLVGLHYPLYVFDHDTGERTRKCWGCRTELDRHSGRYHQTHGQQAP